jgi:hypothetical protein
VQAFLLVNAANVTVDFKAGWSAPTGATAQWGGSIGQPSAGVAGFGVPATSGTPTLLNAIGGTQAVATNAGTTGVYLIGIFFDGGTAGNIVLQWAQNTSDAGNLKLLKGSTLQIKRPVV